MEYRCYFLGPDGRIAGRREFTADTDAEALTMARSFYAESATLHGFELWGNMRCLHRED